MTKEAHLDLLVGGRAISRFLFGTEEKAKVIYPLRQQLGLFFLGGRSPLGGGSCASASKRWRSKPKP